jgi:hypothetical protein
MSMMLHEAFAGLWPLVWKFGTTSGLIILLMAGYFFMPAPVAALFPNLRKFLPWAAGAIAVSFVSYAVGVADEHNRAVAQNKVAVQVAVDAGDRAREAAVALVRAQMAQEAKDIPAVGASVGGAPVRKHWISAPKRVRKPDPNNRYPK